MTCKNCNAAIGPEDVFCGNCGLKVEVAAHSSQPTIQKAASSIPSVPIKKAVPEASKTSKSDSPLTPINSPTRRKLRAFFLGGTTLTGMGLIGFLVSLMMPDVVNGAVFFFGPCLIALVALILATAIKRVSVMSALFSVAGALVAFICMGLLPASLPDPGLGGIAIIYILAFAVFLIPTCLFRKG